MKDNGAMTLREERPAAAEESLDQETDQLTRIRTWGCRYSIGLPSGEELPETQDWNEEVWRKETGGY